jgi:hypothetical protein
VKRADKRLADVIDIATARKLPPMPSPRQAAITSAVTALRARIRRRARRLAA